MNEAAKPLSELEASHVETLARRANWLTKRVASAEVSHSGVQHDKKELDALVWALSVLNPSGNAAFSALEEPPIRESDGEIWTPSDATPRKRKTTGSRYYPNGSL